MPTAPNLAHFDRQNRRALLRGAAALAATAVLPAFAQTTADPVAAPAVPVKPFTIVLPFAPGGRSSWLAQRMAVGLHDLLGETITVEHRPGNAMKRVAEFASSPPDGRTLLAAMIRLPRRGVFSHDAENDIVESMVPITVVARDPMVLVMNEQRATDLGIASVPDLLRYARQHPGRLTMASSVDGSTCEQASELFKTLSRTYITRLASNSMTPDAEAVVEGRIDMMFTTLHQARNSIRSRELRALAVTSGSQFAAPGLDRLRTTTPVPLLQSLPPFAGFEIYDYSGLYAPRGTSADIADRLQQACARVLADTAVRSLLLNQNAIPDGLTRVEFAQLELAEERRWRQARGRW